MAFMFLYALFARLYAVEVKEKFNVDLTKEYYEEMMHAACHILHGQFESTEELFIPTRAMSTYLTTKDYIESTVITCMNLFTKDENVAIGFHKSINTLIDMNDSENYLTVVRS